MPNPVKSDNLKTIIVDKFNGRGTRYRNGDMNSGMSPVSSSTSVPWGYDTQQVSGVLVFDQVATSIKGSVITDCVVAGKERIEDSGSGYQSYLYCVGHLGRVYKIQVNNVTTKTPDYDNPVLLATLALGQTFQFGGSFDFYTIGGTEYILIGHDTGVTRLDLAGTNETAIGISDATHWIANVPRRNVQFIGSIFYTNGSNLAKIDSTGAVVSYTALSPGFPSNMQSRDVRVTADGRYLVTTVTRSPLANILLTIPDTGSISATDSLLVYWNGTDTGASSSTYFPYFPLSAYYTFGSKEYVFGEQVGGAMLGTPNGVINVLEFESAPLPNAVSSSGDYMGWFATRFVNGSQKVICNLYGTIDNETPIGFYKQLLLSSTLDGGDIIRVPFASVVSSWQASGATSGYSNQPFQLYGTGKSYFSTLEYNGSTTAYNFYAFHNVVDFQSSANTGNYQTQNQLFGKKIKPTAVRVYFEPTGATNSLVSFRIDLIGMNGNVLTGGSYTFSSANQISTTADSGTYPTTVGATPALGLRITNLGYLTPFIHKVEIDYTSYGD